MANTLIQILIALIVAGFILWAVRQVIGLIPMALALGAGSEAYAPLARAIIGGLGVSVVLTVFIVPAAYLIVKGRQETPAAPTTAEVTEPPAEPAAA